jgi:hypothetical protein
MDSSAVLKRARIRSMIDLTANSASGVLRGGAAAAAIRVDTTERPTKIGKGRRLRLRLRLRMEAKPNRASSVEENFQIQTC